MTARRRVLLVAAVALAGAMPARGQTQDASPSPASPVAGAAAAPASISAVRPAPPLAVARPAVAADAQMSQPPAAQAPGAPAQTAPPVIALNLPDAERIAVQNHPQIQIAQHRANYAAAQVKQVQSFYFPQASGNITGVVAENDSRITAGALNNPQIFDRFATGAYVSQYVTDFGRTQALVRSSNEHARAQAADVDTSRADVLLQLHEAYFGVLRARVVLTVAQQTVKDRRLISDQVGVMAKNQLKSGLDVAFANVDLSQAQLLLIQAQNDLQASYANLSTALGNREQSAYELAELPTPAAPPSDFVEVVQAAFQNRPELAGQRLEVDAAHSYAIAERDLWFPMMTAAGAAGVAPYRADQLTSRYAAAGFNINVPIFNGHLFSSLRTQANEQFRAQQQALRDLEDRIARDVRTAWLNARSAYDRLAVTEQLLNQARLGEDLASQRYKMGLSSIIELSQAQLNLTQAEIAEATAKYEYQARTSELLYQQGLLR